jgi:hypothetical protein
MFYILKRDFKCVRSRVLSRVNIHLYRIGEVQILDLEFGNLCQKSVKDIER